jgi:transcriptional regulator with XRE-family HTH domain
MRNDIYLKAMGKRIREIRKTKKMSLETLAKGSSINISNLSFLERGRRDPHILSLKSIADILEVDVKDFI